MNLQGLLALLKVQEAAFSGVGILAVLCTLLEVSKIPINPWSWLAKSIGKAINADMYERLCQIEQKLDSHITMDDRRAVDGSRTRILHFNNELLRDLPHTKEEFIEILTEIDAYEKYCREHPDYPNNRAVLAIQNIKGNYQRRLDKHDFLNRM